MTTADLGVLESRRVQLQSEIADARAHARALAQALRRLDCTVLSFDPDAALSTRPVLEWNVRGETQREIMVVLAQAERPLLPREIAEAILARRGAHQDAASVYVLKYRVRCAVRRCLRLGLVSVRRLSDPRYKVYDLL